MRLPKNISVFGDINHRDKNCRVEKTEQKEFFGDLKELRPEYWKIAIHPKNEGKRSYQQAQAEQEDGALNTGASDIIIPCKIPFVCELKRVDHSLCSITKDQIEYLTDAKAMGAFVCVALGKAGAWAALMEWEKILLELR